MECVFDGWFCWLFLNYDVLCYVICWIFEGVDSDVIVKQVINLLISFFGMFGFYQGEELGQIEIDILFEELIDFGYVDFWFVIKGCDGCWMLMVWDVDVKNVDFLIVEKMWLLVKVL